MDWADVLPSRIAIQQSSWERNKRVQRARAAGLKLREIAADLGVTIERVRQYEAKALRNDRQKRPPPVVAFFRDQRDMISLAAKMAKVK